MHAQELYIEKPGESPVCHAVETIRPHRRGVLMKIVGIDSRTDAERLVGSMLSVPETALPPLGEHEFYYYEVIGFRVETATGAHVGTITDTFHTGSNDVWVVRAGDHEHLIPVIADVVRRIDRSHGTVVIEPIEGMLDS
jgi:16S rRNA processing protein RimM